MSSMENSENKTQQFKLDISSKAVEKGLDMAKDFLNKLIGPTVEEAGLLLKDQMTYWKFKNQIKILNKAKVQCEKNNISTKAISLKLLCPLLDNCALEEDEFLQDKWAILLANLVDSAQNIENHVFPYILSQISKNEFTIIETAYSEKIAQLVELNSELATFLQNKDEVIKKSNAQIAEINDEFIKILKIDKSLHSAAINELRDRKSKLEKDLSEIKHYREQGIRSKINKPIEVSQHLEDFELSNLTRLGVVKEVQEIYSETQNLEIPNKPDENYLYVKFDPDVYSETDNIITDLGILFLKACNEKKPVDSGVST